VSGAAPSADGLRGQRARFLLFGAANMRAAS
jgi:hypothetical protein